MKDCPDWNEKAAYNLLDSQRQGYISHPQLYAFMKTNCKYEATDEELIAIIRRIDGSGDGKLNFEEFKSICQSIILKNTDLQHVEDQGEHLAGEKEIDGNKAVPFKKNAPRPVVAPLKTGN